MTINGDGGYSLLAAYIGRPVAQVGWLGLKVRGYLVPFCIYEPSELSQWLCYDDSTINIRTFIRHKDRHRVITFQTT